MKLLRCIDCGRITDGTDLRPSWPVTGATVDEPYDICPCGGTDFEEVGEPCPLCGRFDCDKPARFGSVQVVVENTVLDLLDQVLPGGYSDRIRIGQPELVEGAYSTIQDYPLAVSVNGGIVRARLRVRVIVEED